MATTVHEPPKLTTGDPALPPTSGGGWGSSPALGRFRAVEDSSPASRTGVWVGLAAITMTFAAFTSAMIVRQGSAYDWQHFALPGVLYVDTAVLLASSLTLELARKRVNAFLRGAQAHRSAGSLYLWLTLALGLLFVAGQYRAWLQLRSQGLYLASNPSASFFYLFTVLHALHILGGMVGLTLVVWRFSKRQPTLRISTLSTVSYYWHFMDVLWIYLLLLLWSRI
jgi:cytochrome c oxidase subunit III